MLIRGTTTQKNRTLSRVRFVFQPSSVEALTLGEFGIGEIENQLRGATGRNVDRPLLADGLSVDQLGDADGVVAPLLAGLQLLGAEGSNAARTAGRVARQVHLRVRGDVQSDHGYRVILGLLSNHRSVEHDPLRISGAKLDRLTLSLLFTVDLVLNFHDVRVYEPVLKSTRHELTDLAVTGRRMTVDRNGRIFRRNRDRQQSRVGVDRFLEEKLPALRDLDAA